MRNSHYIILFLFLFSCSNYQKLLKSDDLNLKLEKAKEYYMKDDFGRAMPLLEELSTLFRGKDKAEEVYYYYALCHYKLDDNLMAAYLFNRYIRTFPKGKHSEECNYMKALCYYLEAPIYSLESKNTERAINELQIFIDKYPSSSRVEKCNVLIDELRSKLAKKAFEISKQYYITEHYRASVISFNNVLNDFPGTIYREEIQFLILDGLYLLAINSVENKKEDRLEETLDAYEMFIDNYPESTYLKKAKNIYTRILEKLKELKKS